MTSRFSLGLLGSQRASEAWRAPLVVNLTASVKHFSKEGGNLQSPWTIKGIMRAVDVKFTIL